MEFDLKRLHCRQDALCEDVRLDSAVGVIANAYPLIVGECSARSAMTCRVWS